MASKASIESGRKQPSHNGVTKIMRRLLVKVFSYYHRCVGLRNTEHELNFMEIKF